MWRLPIPKLACLFYVHHFLLAQNLSSKYIAPPESDDAYKHASRIELVKKLQKQFYRGHRGVLAYSSVDFAIVQVGQWHRKGYLVGGGG